MTEIMRGVTQAGGTARRPPSRATRWRGKPERRRRPPTGTTIQQVDRVVRRVAPADDPRLAIAVVVDEPQGGHLGGAVAAPIFKEIAVEACATCTCRRVSRWRGRATFREAAGAKRRRPRWRLRGARRADARPTRRRPRRRAPPMRHPTTTRWAKILPSRAPGTRWPAPRGLKSDGEVPESVTVPNFAGMSLGQAIHAAHKSGVERAFDDPEGRATGVALGQRPAPGPAPRGVICRVAFGRRP